MHGNTHKRRAGATDRVVPIGGFLEHDVRASYRWLGHKGITECISLDPEYRAGREHYEHNKTHNAFPRTWHARSEDDVVSFVRKHHKNRMVAFSLNERSTILRNERGFARGAYEHEIKKASNLLIDIDPESSPISEAHQTALETFLGEADAYFQDIGLSKPVRAFSGRGYHLLFAYPAITVAECPDLAMRQRRFLESFADDYFKELSRLEAKVDTNVADLRRVVKVYGTSKVGGPISRFYGGERTEDPELRAYLINMKVEAPPGEGGKLGRPAFGPALLSVGTELPQIVQTLLRTDEKARALWEGRGKTEGDQSGFTYDFSFARKLLASGVTDLSDVATALALRPTGAFASNGRSELYLRRTIARVLMS